MMEELMGRAQGYCRGKGGSLHLTSLVNGMLGADGVVGGSLALAVGAAYASNLIGRETVVVAYFGDGASNAGLFHEAANLASILSAPVLFVCENNQWALSTRTTEVTAGPGIADRAASYGIPGRSVDGNDVLAVIDAATPLVERARIGQGPSLLEAKTYRMGLHSLYSSTGGDDRDPAELEDWANKDPVDRTRALLLGLGEEPRVAEVEREVDELIARAITDAADSPYPEPSAAYEDVYSLSNVVGPDRLS
jgi:pyruvate dehydrogenase E1 component alpha subunit